MKAPTGRLKAEQIPEASVRGFTSRRQQVYEVVKNITTAEWLPASKKINTCLIDASNLVRQWQDHPSAHVIPIWIRRRLCGQKPMQSERICFILVSGARRRHEQLAPAKDQAIVVFCTSPNAGLASMV